MTAVRRRGRPGDRPKVSAAATMVVYAPPLVWPAAIDTYRVTR